MSELAETLLSACVVLPLFGWLAQQCVTRPSNRRAWAVTTSALTLAACAGLLALLVCERGSVHVGDGQWLSIGGSPPLISGLTLRSDALAAFFALIASASALCVVSSKGEPSPREESEGNHEAHALFSLLVTLLAFFATDLLGLYAFWLLGQFAALWSARDSGTRLWAVTRFGDAMFAVGLLFAWSQFGSLRIADVLSREQLGLLSIANPAAAGFLGLCFGTAVLTRCGMFPFTFWLGQSQSTSSRLAVHTLSIVPLGMYAAIRVLPVLVGGGEIGVLFAAVGAMTAVATAFFALTETRWPRTVTLLATGHLGFALIGLSLGTPAGLAAATMIVVCQLPTVVSLLLVGDADPGADSQPARSAGWAGGAVRIAGLFVLVSGFWGQNAVIAQLWELGRDEAVPRGFPVSLANGLGWLAIGAMFLAALAAARAFVAASSTRKSPLSSGFCLSDVPVLVGLSLGPLLGSVPVLRSRLFPAQMHSSESLFVPGLALPVVLAGAVVGWIVSRGRQRTSQFESLARLSRTRFYEDELCDRVYPGVSVTVGWIGRGCEWLFVEKGGELLGRGRERLTRQIASLQTGAVTFYVLSLLLTGAGLLAVLLTLGRTQ